MSARTPRSAWLALLPTPLRARVEAGGPWQAVLGNSSWLLFDRLVRLLLAITVGAWVARYLGPTRFGELAFVLAFIAFFQSIAALGLDGVVVRDIARSRSDAGTILGTAFRLRLVSGMLAWMMGIACMALLRPGDAQALYLVAVVGGILVFQAADTVDLWFQSQSQNRRTVAAKLVAYVTSSGLKVGLILIQAPLLAFACAVLLESVAVAAALAISYRRYPAGGKWNGSVAMAKVLARQSWPLMLSGGAVIIYTRIDQLMLGEMLGERELGIYTAALLLSQIWHVIPMTLMPSIAPYIAQKKVRDEVEYRDALIHVFRLFVVLALVVSVTTAVAAPILIDVLFGAQYQASAAVLSIHVFTNVFVFLGVAHSLWVVNEDRTQVRLWGTALAGALAVTINYFVIPKYGLAGVAVVAVFTQFVAAVGINALLARDSLVLQLRAVGLRSMP